MHVFDRMFRRQQEASVKEVFKEILPDLYRQYDQEVPGVVVAAMERIGVDLYIDFEED